LAQEFAMPAARIAITAIGVAVTLARHPAVRAGMRVAAPYVLSPRNRARAAELTRDAAYNAGVVVRRIVPRNIIR
jgi:hypothetical protein